MKRKHQWLISGWVEAGRTPRADEWECKHCGMVLDDGYSASSAYCEVEA